MATSLQQQLEKLAVPQTSILLQRKDKASLLFDPKEAANLERETIFAIGINGLEELKLIDPSFSKFESTLFSENSKSFERAIQTRELNNKLDKKIESFLSSLSPFLLLRPSQKTLEWLIHRFHIHEYNIDSLLKCALPYHETRLFVRIIQLLNLSKPSNKWHWLEPLQISRLPLSKKELIKHCAKDLGFMTFVCDIFQDLAKMKDKQNMDNRWNLPISFYVSTIIGALRLQTTLELNTIAVLLPNILRGLDASWPLLENSSLMIIAQLLHSAQFSAKLLEPLLKRILEISNEESSCQRIICMNILLQTQNKKHVNLIRRICRQCIDKAVIKHVVLVSHKYDIEHFLSFLLHLLIATILDSKNLSKKEKKKKNKKKEMGAFALFRIIVSRCTFESKFCIPVMKYILKSYVTNHQQMKKRNIEKLTIKTKKMLESVNKKCMLDVHEVLDLCLEKFSREEQIILQKLFNPTKSSYSEIHHSNDTNLYLSLNNSIQISRIFAIENLLKHRHKYDEEFVQRLLLERLKEDNPKVLIKVLSADQILIEVLPSPDLVEALVSILFRKIKGKQQGSLVVKAALKILCSEELYVSLPENLKEKVFYTLLPFLHPINLTEVELTKLLLQSGIKQQIPYITPIAEGTFKLLDKKEGITEADMINFNINILCEISQLIRTSKTEDKLINNLIDYSKSKSKWATKLQFILASLMPLILDNIRDEERLVDMAMKVLNFAEIILNNNKKHLFTSGCNELLNQDSSECMRICLEALKQRKFPLITLIHCLRRIPNCFEKSSHSPESVWLLHKSEINQVNKFHHLQFKMFMLLAEHLNSSDSLCSIFKTMIKFFFKIFYKESKSLLNMLSFIWTCFICPEDERMISFSRQCQIRALSVTISYLKLCSVDDEFIQKFIPLLLIALNNSLAPIRQLTLQCIEQLNVKPSKKNFYRPLILKLFEHGSEIQADHRQVPQIISEVLKYKTYSGTLDKLLEFMTSDDVSQYIQAGLLQILRVIESEKILLSVIPKASSLIKKANLTVSEKIIVECVLQMFVPQVAASVASSADTWTFLLNSLQNRKLQLKEKSCQEVAMKQISKEFFLALPSDSQKVKLLDGLVNILVSDADSQSFAVVNRTFRKLLMNGELVVMLLKSYLQKPTKISLREKRSKSVFHQSQHKTSKTLMESEDWNRIIVILETIQNKKMKNIHLLIPELCGILQYCIEMENQEPLEYSKQLVLLCLHHCFYKLAPYGVILESSELNENDMNLELVVQCLRVSQNPQTHNYALHLLAFAAKLFPEHVVHNAMAIFTFMGASIVRQDDAYSFQVIIRTIEAIVPAILKGSEEHKKSKEETQILVITIIRIFVDALFDIPEHRRLPVFSSLLHTVDSEMFLWVALALIFEHYVSSWSENSNAQQNDDAQIRKYHSPTDMAQQFALQLSEKFPAPDQVKAVTYLVHFLVSLPIDKEQTPQYTYKSKRKKPTEAEIIRDSLFNVDNHSSKELRHFKFSILSYLSALFNRETLLNELSEVSEEKKLVLAALYEDLIQHLLFFLKRTSYLIEENALKSSSKFWRALMHRLYDILEKVNFLLPSEMFVTIIKNLLKNEQLLIKRKSLELLNSKLQHHPEAFEGKQMKILLEIIDPLLLIIKINENKENGEEIAVTRQTAFMSLKLISRLLGTEHLEKSKIIMSEVITVFISSPPSSPVCASSLVCLAELCGCLQAHTIPFLSKFMPNFLEILLDLDTLLKNDLLLISAVNVVHKLVERLPNFLSPYFKSVLYSLCVISSVKDDNSKTALATRLKAILHNLATKTPSRVLLPGVQLSYETILSKSPKAVDVLMEVLNEFIQTIGKDDLQSNLTVLLTFFLNALDYRDQQPKAPLSMIASVEDSILNPFLSMVLKLSEVTFRPVFFKVFDWAVTAETSRARVITFYRMTNKIADKLKSLFVLFAGHFVKNAANLLDENNSSKGFNPEGKREIEEACLLVQNILDCLRKCFLYDNESFVTKERFDTLLQPLVDQVENHIGDNSVYEERINKYLSPCIAHLASAVANDALWKQLNYQILLKTRHHLPMVRCAALKVIEDLSKRLGEDYMTLLPETIPFLAEMMEDESEEVEQKCQMVLTELEKTLGEPLQKYF